jgi:ABC transporter substrate binding protein (PQQ-dependent alcohol dehydrogenase system)
MWLINTRFLQFLLFCFCFQFFFSGITFAKGQQVIDIAYLMQTPKNKPPLSNLDPIIIDKGVLGAQLGVEDNNTTGKFTRQKFVLKQFIIPADGNVLEVFNKQIAKKHHFVVTNLSPELTLALADVEQADDMLFLDATTIDDDLRNQLCRANVLHILPSRAMRADAIAQYFMKKRWSKWFLVAGNTKADQLYVQALKRAAKRYGMDIVQEKIWTHDYDARRTAQSEIAVFTQADDDYDVLVVADEQGLFGEYLDYRTWIPRPVAGTQGLTASAWHRTHEQWGATQIQNRFKDQAGRWMEEEDYGAYLAVRTIGEAASRMQTNELNPIKDYILSDNFTLQGYKGAALSFRLWDHQLRQPILLTAPRSLVSVAPIEGFLHPKTELDTLGYDQPETGCQWSKH